MDLNELQSTRKLLSNLGAVDKELEGQAGYIYATHDHIFCVRVVSTPRGRVFRIYLSNSEPEAADLLGIELKILEWLSPIACA